MLVWSLDLYGVMSCIFSYNLTIGYGYILKKQIYFTFSIFYYNPLVNRN
jgi:hypothetical protein